MHKNAHQPLDDHPELTRIYHVDHRGNCVALEFRLEGKVGRSKWWWVVWSVMIAMGWQGLRWLLEDIALWITVIVFALLMMKVLLGTVSYESILALPGLGIQLTTHHGGSSTFPLSSSTTLIPLSALREPDSIFIHEGIRRWSVGYYAGVLATTWEVDGTGRDMGKEKEIKVVHLMFPQLRPRYAILEEVYHSVREIMWDEYAEDTIVEKPR